MAANVGVSGSALHLTARKEASAWANFTTGAIESRDKAFWEATGSSAFRVCVSGSLPGGPGTGFGYWPAFWMMPNDASCWPDHGELCVGARPRPLPPSPFFVCARLLTRPLAETSWSK